MTAPKLGIQMRQVAYHMLTRDLSVAIRGKPIVKAISDWPLTVAVKKACGESWETEIVASEEPRKVD